MGRKKNYEAKERIAKTARKLFMEKGYTETSINDIAVACGIDKTYVQRHFPKKEAFIKGFLEDLLDYTDAFLAGKHQKTDNCFVNLYIIGQIHYAFLLKSDRMTKLTFDIVSNRQLTEAMIRLDVDWATDYMKGLSLDQQTELRDNIAMIMGGTYELIYRYLIEGKRISPEVFQKKAMTMFMVAQGFSKEEADLTFAPYRLSDKDFMDALAYLESKLFP